MATYVYDITKNSELQRFKKDLDETVNFIYTKEFKNFIADKSLEELAKLSASLGGFGTGEEHDVFLAKVEEYKKNHKKEIGDDYVLIFNDTTLTQDEMYWVSESTRTNYPDGISIAYIIEYGTGLLGTAQEDWQVNVNGHGAKGWGYMKDEKLYRSTGISGRFVYAQLLAIVEKNFGKWLDEYAKKEGYW